MDGWMDGWVDGWVGGWVGVKAVLRIAYSNQQMDGTNNSRGKYIFWRVKGDMQMKTATHR
jgi:hypothetical protein